ncbi:Uncharacterised protein [Burkholderia pseudomallei]|uniref:hypothetical protein n=1 Tax=Burkholderia pseudomallei TaxID=28450 RepID=UPI0005E7F025|nr:hypothetical protein [Burkholderia pseudomallei]QUN86050.1 hypothetical protein KEX46_14425 [Burkholderia pseudomallei]CPH57176.1 Uncharacterised protein [Burkholderia pseudomallei]
MAWAQIAEKLLDPYSTRARLAPGLLLLLPVILFLVCTLGPKSPLLTALSSVLMACGGPYALSSFVRTYGQRAQDRLYLAWGGKPTTLILRHSDTRLPLGTKKLYHEHIATKFNLSVPSAEDEARDMAAADNVYLDATNRVIQATRDSKRYPLVFKELVAYGFNRNCYGIRWIGAAVSLAVFSLTLAHIGALPWRDWPAFSDKLASITTESGLSLLVSAGMLLVWLFHFTGGTVKQSGFTYAERLCEALTKVPRPANRTKKAT